MFFKSFSIGFFTIFLFVGCSSKVLDKSNAFHEVTTDFKSITSRLATSEFCEKINKNTTLYVTDFVNESNLENKSQLGFLLSNELKVNLLKASCTKNVAIKSFDLGHNLKMGQNGAKILTRDLSQLKVQSIEDDKQIAVGTYLLTNKQFILFLKLINLDDGNTVISSTSSSALTSEIQDLEGVENVDDTPYIRKPFHL